jgi:hypothetical protein
LSISISLTSSWKNVFGRCCWKVSRVILIGQTCIDLRSISNETSGSNTSSTCLLTYLTKFKPINEIDLTCWFDQIDVRTIMVPIKNNPHLMVNTKSSSLTNIPKWKS